jgi:hypothetical protein
MEVAKFLIRHLNRDGAKGAKKAINLLRVLRASAAKKP